MITPGIKLTNQTLPSGIFSALEEANITESILFSTNDVVLRWVAREEWTYTLEFDGTFFTLPTVYYSCNLIIKNL